MSWYQKPRQLEFGQYFRQPWDAWPKGETIDGGLAPDGLPYRVRSLTWKRVRDRDPQPPRFPHPPTPQPELPWSAPPALSFDLDRWLRVSNRLSKTHHRRSHAVLTHQLALTTELIAAVEDRGALRQLVAQLPKGERRCIAEGRLRQLEAADRRGHRQPGPTFDPTRMPTHRLEHLAQHMPAGERLELVRDELRARLSHA